MTTFEVNDMTCGGCVAAITAALREADATAVVTADLPTHRVAITGTLAPAAAAEVLRDAGFTPVLIPA